jgi:ABC-type amino acid transport system permease subunit
MEAGRSLGLNYAVTMRKIILPQAIKNILPALFNELITLLKETAVVGYIAVMDLTRAGDMIRSRTYDAFMPLLVVAAIYLLIVLSLTMVMAKLERRLRRSDNR